MKESVVFKVTRDVGVSGKIVDLESIKKSFIKAEPASHSPTMTYLLLFEMS